VSAAVRQVVTGFAGAGVTTVSADFTDGPTGGIGVALAGSAIVFVVAGDKNSGTFTPPSAAPTVPVDLRTADVSLMMAWGTAAGGESVVSGTIGANVAGSQVWLIELTDTVNTGAWSVAASATNNSDGSTVTVWSTGTTGAATRAGMAIAAVGSDSVNTAGTPTWSNSFTAERITASGGGQAGLWGSSKAISAGATAETTLTRTGGTADQHSGAILVMGRAATISGTADAPLGGLTATATGVHTVPATTAAPLGALTAAASGTVTPNTNVAVPLGALTAAASGTIERSASAVAPLGGLAAAAAGGVFAAPTAVAPLGGLAVSGSAVRSTAATGTAALGGLAVAAAGVRTLVGALTTAPLGALTATAVGVVVVGEPPEVPALSPTVVVYTTMRPDVALTVDRDEYFHLDRYGILIA
jgi:hypothetical protein